MGVAASWESLLVGVINQGGFTLLLMGVRSSWEFGHRDPPPFSPCGCQSLWLIHAHPERFGVGSRSIQSPWLSVRVAVSCLGAFRGHGSCVRYGCDHR